MQCVYTSLNHFITYLDVYNHHCKQESDSTNTKALFVTSSWQLHLFACLYYP